MRTLREVQDELERLAGTPQPECVGNQRADQPLIGVVRAAVLGSRIEREAEDAIEAYLRAAGRPEAGASADIVPGPKSEPLPLETGVRQDPDSAA